MKYLLVIGLLIVVCFFGGATLLGVYGYKETRLERTPTPISVVVTAPSTSTQPAPALAGTKGLSDLQWAAQNGEVNVQVVQGKLAGGQLTARLDINVGQDDTNWVTAIDKDGKRVNVLRKGEFGTVWIADNLRGPAN